MKLAVCPASNVAEADEPGERASEKSAPLPERATRCGLAGEFEVTVSVPFRGPVVAGVNVTSRLQLAPTSRFAPQSPLCAKFSLMAMLVMLSVASPALESISVWAALVMPTFRVPKSRLVAERPTTGTAVVPEPRSGMT